MVEYALGVDGVTMHRRSPRSTTTADYPLIGDAREDSTMLHRVTIRMTGMPHKRGARVFTGAGASCTAALSRAISDMPDDARKAWWKAEPTDDGVMVAGYRRFHLTQQHPRQA